MRLPLDKVSLWYDRKLRSFILQTIVLALFVWCCLSLWHVLQNNIDNRGIEIGFKFLKDTAGFNIIFHLIDYNEQSTYGRVFFVGLLNTLLVSGIGIFFATLLGIILGISRLSCVKLVRTLATIIVETVRNIPLLLQLFLWYFVVLRSAPYPENSISLFNTIFINNRGIYTPMPITSSLSIIHFLIASLLFICSLFFFNFEKRYCLTFGKKQTLRYFVALGLMGIAIIEFFLFSSSLTFEFPTLGRFNFENGLNLLPEFIALLLALSIYTAVYIGEIVRMGIQSVPKEQMEASLALGMSYFQSLRLIIIPQSLKVILPPLTNQYLNLIKNSSLATAIAYPDLVSIFAGTALNQTGQAVEIIAMTMAVYLFISLSLSGLMLIYEKHIRF